jgi:hypothetical protein
MMVYNIHDSWVYKTLYTGRWTVILFVRLLRYISITRRFECYIYFRHQVDSLE